MEDGYAKKKDHGLSDCGVAYGMRAGVGDCSARRRCLRYPTGPGLVFPCDRARLRQSAVQVIPEFGYLQEAMMRSPSSFFLDAVRPYLRGFRLSYLFMSVSIVVLEVVFHAISAPLGTHDILILAALCALLSVAP